MGAVEVIDNWYKRVPHTHYMNLTITATQGGSGAFRIRPVFMYAKGFLFHPTPDELFMEADVHFSDRGFENPDHSKFWFHRGGYVREESETWGYSQDVFLSEAENGLLTGIGDSIGNTGAKCFWVVAAGNRVKRWTPGGDPRDPDGEAGGTPL